MLLYKERTVYACLLLQVIVLHTNKMLLIVYPLTVLHVQEF